MILLWWYNGGIIGWSILQHGNGMIQSSIKQIGSSQADRINELLFLLHPLLVLIQVLIHCSVRQIPIQWQGNTNGYLDCIIIVVARCFVFVMQ